MSMVFLELLLFSSLLSFFSFFIFKMKLKIDSLV